MSRVVIRNTSNSNIGFSWGFLFKGQQALVEESRLSAGDRRMISAKNLFMAPEGAAVPVVEKKEEVKADGTKDKGAPEEADGKPVPPKSEVKPAPVPVEPKPSAPPAAASPEPPPAETKPKYTEEQLKLMTKTELKKLSEGLGADGRSRASMIAKILESQEK